ncbi:MAG: queuosine precursor transporter, partial [Chitinophagaceae bacterium]|nr:queuosine precursor transporter [Chitinophagaceae bacterium]
FKPMNLTLFGESGLAFNLTCGVLLWPLEFVITDIVNEYYGPKAVRRTSLIAVALISYAFIMFYLAMWAAPAGFWVESKMQNGVPSMQLAFEAIFGQGMWIIIGSIIAFMVSQLIDVTVFHQIKKRTGDKMIWLRSTGSTVVSQLVDSFVVLFIAFKIGNGWAWSTVLAVGVVNYMYKFTMAIVLTPLIHLIRNRIENYVGAEAAEKMKREAMGEDANI